METEMKDDAENGIKAASNAFETEIDELIVGFASDRLDGSTFSLLVGIAHLKKALIPHHDALMKLDMDIDLCLAAITRPMSKGNLDGKAKQKANELMEEVRRTAEGGELDKSETEDDGDQRIKDALLKFVSFAENCGKAQGA